MKACIIISFIEQAYYSNIHCFQNILFLLLQQNNLNEKLEVILKVHIVILCLFLYCKVLRKLFCNLLLDWVKVRKVYSNKSSE